MLGLKSCATTTQLPQNFKKKIIFSSMYVFVWRLMPVDVVLLKPLDGIRALGTGLCKLYGLWPTEISFQLPMFFGLLCFVLLCFETECLCNPGCLGTCVVQAGLNLQRSFVFLVLGLKGSIATHCGFTPSESLFYFLAEEIAQWVRADSY